MHYGANTNGICVDDFWNEIYEGPGIKSAIELSGKSGGSEIYDYIPEGVLHEMEEDMKRKSL